MNNDNNDCAICVYCIYCDELPFCKGIGNVKICRRSDCPSECMPCKGYSWNEKE